MNLSVLQEQPEQYDLFEAVRLIQKQWLADEDAHFIGTDALPAKELVRFSVSQHFGVPNNSVEKVAIAPYLLSSHKKVRLQTSLLGLTGVNGVLPKHYSELVLQRLKQKDRAMADFYDLFNHRLLSLFYRAWEKYKVPLAYEAVVSGKSHLLTDLLTGLSGARTENELYFGGFFAQRPRNVKNLQYMLEVLSGCVVQIKQFIGRWLLLAEHERTRLASRLSPEGQFSALGGGATLGEKVWDVSSAIDIELAVTNRDVARALLPGAPSFGIMKQITERYLPPGVRVRWRLRACFKDLPVAMLGGAGPLLGQGSGLCVRRQRLNEKTSLTIA